MKKEILLGTLAVGLMGLSLTACARKKHVVAPPAPAPAAVTQPAAPQPAPKSAPRAEAQNLEYVKK